MDKQKEKIENEEDDANDSNDHYTGWPRKNTTPTITNFKEIRD